MSDSAKILIVEGRFYEDIADEMYKGASQVLDAAGMGYERLAVPGAFEVPPWKSDRPRTGMLALSVSAVLSEAGQHITTMCVRNQPAP